MLTLSLLKGPNLFLFFRVLYVQSVALVWNTFLSYRTNRSLRMRNDAVTDNVEL